MIETIVEISDLSRILYDNLFRHATTRVLLIIRVLIKEDVLSADNSVQISLQVQL